MTESGVLEAHLFLINGIRSVDLDFISRYNELTKVSDLIAYSGHSGLGANIRALALMGEFQPKQYQVFLINGCDTFAYVDDSLSRAHEIANPGPGSKRYLDIITNAMPSYFHSNARANMAVVDAMVGRTKTYRQMFESFDRAQRAAVTGEEDNVWPAPFTEE